MSVVRGGLRVGAAAFASAAAMAGLAMGVPAVATAETGGNDSAATQAAPDQTGTGDRAASETRRRASNASAAHTAAGATVAGPRASSRSATPRPRPASGSNADPDAPEPSVAVSGAGLTKAIEADPPGPTVSQPSGIAAPITPTIPSMRATSAAAADTASANRPHPAATGTASATPPSGPSTGPLGEALQLAAAQLLDRTQSRRTAIPVASSVGTWSPG